MAHNRVTAAYPLHGRRYDRRPWCDLISTASVGRETAIDPVFLHSPQYECAPLGDVLGCSITLKVETLNPVRSFKGRGTETALSWIAERAEAPTAVCASAGNLGRPWPTAVRGAASR